MKLLHLNIVVFLLIILSACTRTDHPRAFYYWKSRVKIDTVEHRYFQALEAKKLYIRLFDVDNETGLPLPLGMIQGFDATQLKTNYIPVVFITNRCFENSTLTNNQQLAGKVNGLIRQICDSNKISPVKEIQIDCDWTLSTRAAYFAFLKALKKQSGKRLSCTVRLHQLRYFEKTGVPPVDRAVIMCYATTNPDEISTGNSILDVELLKKYCSRIDSYPLPFDLALPLYSWAVVSNHMGKYKLINGLTRKDLEQNKDLEPMADGTFRTCSDMVLNGLFLNKDFRVRAEEINPATIQQVVRYFQEKVHSEYSIIYYHLDGKFLNRFPIQTL